MQSGKLRAVPVSVAGEREASNSLPLSQTCFRGHCFPTEQKGGSSNKYLTRTLDLSSLDDFVSYHISAELMSFLRVAIHTILSPSAVKWCDLVVANAGWHYLLWGWATSMLWPHSSPAAQWCGKMQVALLEILVALLADLQKCISFLVQGHGEMLLALLSSWNARGLHFSGKWKDLFVQLILQSTVEFVTMHDHYLMQTSHPA